MGGRGRCGGGHWVGVTDVEGGHWVGGASVEVGIGWEWQVWRWTLGGNEYLGGRGQNSGRCMGGRG